MFYVVLCYVMLLYYVMLCYVICYVSLLCDPNLYCCLISYQVLYNLKHHIDENICRGPFVWSLAASWPTRCPTKDRCATCCGQTPTTDMVGEFPQGERGIRSGRTFRNSTTTSTAYRSCRGLISWSWTWVNVGTSDTQYSVYILSSEGKFLISMAPKLGTRLPLSSCLKPASTAEVLRTTADRGYITPNIQMSQRTCIHDSYTYPAARVAR